MALRAGDYRSGGKVVDAAGRRVVKGVAADSALLAGQYRSGGRVFDADGYEVTTSVASPPQRIDATGHRYLITSGIGVLAAGQIVSGGGVVSPLGVPVVQITPAATDYRSGGRVFDVRGRELVVVI